MLLTGIFVVIAGARLLRGTLLGVGAEAISRRGRALLLVVGVGVGFRSGLLANRDGLLLVPAYLVLYRMEARQAAATSLVAVALLALPGVWVHWDVGHRSLHHALLWATGMVSSNCLGTR